MRQPGESHVVQIDCAQFRRPRSGDISCCLKDVELCSQSRTKVALGHLESFVSSLHILRLGFEDALCLLKVKKCAAHFGRNGAPRCGESF